MQNQTKQTINNLTL